MSAEAAVSRDTEASGGSIAEAIAEAGARQRAGQSHGEIGAALRKFIADRRRAIISQYARGDVAAAKLSATMDEALAALFREAANADAAKSIAACAVGGYGRGLLAPHSDIDLLFLHAPGADIAPLLDFILYPLWDAGLKVGHAAHTTRSAVEFAAKDLVARTSYLDARLIAGGAQPFAEFRKQYEKLRKRTKKEFAAAKLAERDERHERSEQSRFLAEPDLKEGKGGLRDLHAIRWLYKYEFERDIDDAKAQKKLLSAEDVAAFRKCERFLWSVRVQLHGLTGRADEKVSFDVQPALAERLGYADRPDMTAAERLMKHYFVNAMEVGRLTRIFSAKIEEERSRLSTRALKILPKTLSKDEAGKKANLKLTVGRLNFDSAAQARKNAADLFRLFRAFAKRPDLDFHPDALALVSASTSLVTSDVRRDPAVAAIFMETLTTAKEPVKTLRVMAETGLLGKYIPSFGKIIGRIEYGLYRRFSIDENVYQSIGVLAEIVHGKAEEKHPIASAIVARQGDLATFFLAALLHEAAWSERGKDETATERLVARISLRLGLSAEDAELVAWCAARHLLMVLTAERRNLAEPQATAQFAKMVGDQRRLDLLLVLSVCHFRVVGAYSWDDWTRRQLSDLYNGASAWLAGGDAALLGRLNERASEVRKSAATLLKDWSPAERERFLGRLSDAMYRTVDAGLIARIGDLARAAEQEGARAAVTARLDEGDVEALVYADDRNGLLSDLAGAVAATGASVRTVQAMTTADGKAIDVFAIQSADGSPLFDPEIVRRLHAKLLAAAKARPAKAPPPARRFGDRRAIFRVAPEVRLDLEASEDCLVVETEGRDRPGLLFELTAALASLSVTIVSAHIATYGARAVDAFYVREASGHKIADKRRLAAIRESLLGVLAGGEAPQSKLPVEP